MQYPLFDYYYNSSLTLDEIISDYLDNFYHKKHGTNKSDKVRNKVLNSTKVAAIDSFSIQQRVVPNYMDFGSALNETIWFMFQSNETQALGVLFAASEWEKRINDIYHFGSAREVRDKAIRISQKYSIFEEMSQSQFERIIDT